MPFIVESPHLLDIFPEQCAYCQTADASSTFRQDFSKLKLGFIPGSVNSETLTAKLPACPGCARWFRRSRILLYPLGGLALSGILWAPMTALLLENTAFPIMAWAGWFGTSLGWLGLGILRKWRRKSLRIAYFGAKEIVYATNCENYATELAKLNDLSFAKKRFVIRFC